MSNRNSFLLGALDKKLYKNKRAFVESGELKT
jgi:hypothetical protein